MHRVPPSITPLVTLIDKYTVLRNTANQYERPVYSLVILDLMKLKRNLKDNK